MKRTRLCAGLLAAAMLSGAVPVYAAETEVSTAGTAESAAEEAAQELAAMGIELIVFDESIVMYSNESAAMYEVPDISYGTVVAASGFPDKVPVEVTGITSTGFYQVNVGGTWYIPAAGLEEDEPEIIVIQTEGLEPGLQELDGELVYVQADGTLLADGYYNYLYFDEEGHYTSGDDSVDLMIDAVLAVCTDETMTKPEKLRAAYLYVRDNFTYLSRAHQSRGSIDWPIESATFMLQNGKGNCYCFAAVFLYLARRIGYDSAYPVSGGVGTNNADHAWVMITMEDGVNYMFDVELEYAYLYRYSNKHSYNLYQMTTATAPFRYYFP